MTNFTVEVETIGQFTHAPYMMVSNSATGEN